MILLPKLAGTCKAISAPNDPIIMVLEHPYLPKVMHRIAHELVELEMRATGTWTRHELEEGGQHGGAALILPPREFLVSAHKENFDVAALRRRFLYASYEAITARLADLLPHANAGKWTDGVLTVRHERPEAVLPDGAGLVEAAAVDSARRFGRGEVVYGGVRAMAWKLAKRDALERAVSLCMAA